MGRRNSLSSLINLQRFRHHHHHGVNSTTSSSSNNNKHDEESTQPVKPLEKQQEPRAALSDRSSSSSTLEDDLSTVSIGNNYTTCLSNKALRRHSTGGSCPLKSVRFGDCQIRSYPQVLGDHPCCSMGCPVELGWDYNQEVDQKVNDFEEQRDHERGHSGQLLLSPEQRRSILSLNEDNTAALRKACRRQCTRKAQRKIQREFFAN